MDFHIIKQAGVSTTQTPGVCATHVRQNYFRRHWCKFRELSNDSKLNNSNASLSFSLRVKMGFYILMQEDQRLKLDQCDPVTNKQ